MDNKPKISVVIPVYNVEKYLRACLDSIVDQTMWEIQIVCVNDSSPDNSRAVLQEYADKDSRIVIIDKSNGGLSSARNAAYPLIRGKYTLFVDSDDWIEIDTCEKTYKKSEETGASMTVFFHQDEGNRDTSAMYRQITPDDKITKEEKLSILNFPTAWSKLWRTDFLLDNKLYFPEGFCYEDNLVNWQAVTLADKISVVPKRFYHYRCNPDAITQTTGEHSMHLIPIYNKIGEFLLESGYYAAYRDKFISMKLENWYWHYCQLSEYLKPRYKAMLREHFNMDDRRFCNDSSELLNKSVREFFLLMIDGGHIGTLKYQIGTQLGTLKYQTGEVIKLPERLLRRWVIKPIKKWLRAA